MKYYFIKYRWRRDRYDNWNHYNELIDTHPVNWISDAKIKLNKGLIDSEYILEFYQEVNEEYYKEYKDEFY